jgi:hypothetical protein
MQLRNARLCLDCEELHEAQQCPLCASESFAFLTRWVPADERRQRQRNRVRENRPAPTKKIVTGGVAGLALIALSRWLLRPASAEDAARSGGNGADGGSR